MTLISSFENVPVQSYIALFLFAQPTYNWKSGNRKKAVEALFWNLKKGLDFYLSSYALLLGKFIDCLNRRHILYC